jgi:beta-aspartyl-peptidase (threonine type)
MYAIAIHGGAGQLNPENYTKEQIREHRQALREALNTGLDKLKNGLSAREAAIASVCVLEDNPLFNSGRGSVLNAEGEVEMDAAVMCGATLQAGGVSGLKSIRHPILGASEIAMRTPHRLLAGAKAEEFLIAQGLETASKEFFITERRREQYQAFLKDRKMRLEHDSRYSTVGAVALDSSGNLAAATSTGGIIGKMPGRVSDSAIIGAGTYADNRTCAISATGMGDEFIRHSAAFQIHARILWMKQDLIPAVEDTLETIASTGGNGGIILIDKEGRCQMRFNSGGLYRAFANSKGILEIGMFRDDCALSF